MNLGAIERRLNKVEGKAGATEPPAQVKAVMDAAEQDDEYKSVLEAHEHTINLIWDRVKVDDDGEVPLSFEEDKAIAVVWSEWQSALMRSAEAAGAPWSEVSPWLTR